MKKSVKKLALNKMTIANLSSSEMNQMAGGAAKTGKCAGGSVLSKCEDFTSRADTLCPIIK